MNGQKNIKKNQNCLTPTWKSGGKLTLEKIVLEPNRLNESSVLCACVHI